MNLKSILAVAVMATCSFAGSAQASLLWTVSATGTIGSGTDPGGVFGTKNANLGGLTYTQTITASVDPTKYNNIYSTVYERELYGPKSLSAFTDTVTVNGYTVTFNVTNVISGTQIVENRTSTNNGYPDEVYTYNDGTDASGNSVLADIILSSSKVAFVPSLDFSQTITQSVITGMNSYTRFAESGRNSGYSVLFTGAITSLTVNAESTTNVPEPTSIALLGLGLLGITTLRRRKSH
jgi:hypothetical protein